MGYKCCAPGCRQGYEGNPKNPDISFHRLPGFNVPPNQELLSKWERALTRSKDETKTKEAVRIRTKNSRVCSLHFTENDFITKSVDRRHGSGRQLNRQLQLRRLKDDAVPSVWPKLREYLSSPPPPPIFIKSSTSSQRIQIKNECQMAIKVETEDEVQTAQELHEKLSQETLPSGFTLLKSPKLSLVKLEATENKGLEIKVSIEIEDNLTFKVFQEHHKINNSIVSHCLYTKSQDKIKSVSEVINIASYLGSEEQLNKDNTYEVIIALSISRTLVCMFLSLLYMQSIEATLVYPTHLQFILEGVPFVEGLSFLQTQLYVL